MNKQYCLIILILTYGLCNGQNLAPNPSFEDNDSCTQLPLWTEINSADYFDACFNYTPQNPFGFQYPASGDAYMGFFTHGNGSAIPDYRELIGGPLLVPLIVGQKYFVSLKVNLANNPTAQCATNNIGVLFTNKIYPKDTVILQPNTPFINNHAHVHTSNIISDTFNWTTISGSFMSDSVYHYIYIGNFFDDEHTDSILLDGDACNSYYFLDDICVSTDSLGCFPATGINQVKSNEEIGFISKSVF